MEVKVINSHDGNWYNVGEIYKVRNSKKYSQIGVQVWNSDDSDKHPDVIMNGDFEYID